ncbi:putative bifunctional diguanylate cyclase/phosphodiesterase [Paenibacillus sp. 481]|uniref:putative bifunctional diguanylate cyclase/phosphodiesterase n=1 Tax=Paenibacillus sp. 481 TaxID=2835869 RepID=UPI001E3328C2|nr:EAL domain-containing protein [Paenibacillus sp. 481]UHA74935.1 EAL domain-containing protein [Paenibacillus sp. 481]
MARSLLPFSSFRTGLIFLVLASMAAIFTQYGIRFSYGAEITFCSAALLVILVLYGSYWSAGTALAVSLCFYFSENASITILLIGLELILVGYVYERKREHLMVWDGLFWFFIGAPFATLFFYLQSESFGSEALMQYFMFAMNGFINGFIADMIITYLPWRRILPEIREKRVYLSQLLTHLSIAIVFVPFVFNLVLDSEQIQADIEQDSLIMVETQTRDVIDDLIAMDEKDKQGLSIGAVIELGKLEYTLINQSSDGLIKLLTLDKRGRTLAVSDQTWFASGARSKHQMEAERSLLVVPDGLVSRTIAERNYYVESSFYRWLPAEEDYDYDTRRWNDGFYAIEIKLQQHPVDRLIAFIPISHFLHISIQVYLHKFLTLFLFCVGAAGFALLVNRFIVRSLANLMDITTGMPMKLLTSQSLPWPDSRIWEVRSLVHNFRITSERLIDMFKEMHRMNEKLVEQTTMLEKSEERMQQLAFYDPLTKLPNRHYFHLTLNKALEQAEAQSSSLALLFIELDRFKPINDSLGHNSGDQLLIKVAQRLSSTISIVSGGHVCACLGGYEFVIMLEDGQRHEAKVVAQRIMSMFSESFLVEADELYVTPNVGIVMYPTDGLASTELVQRAKTALYAAKERGGQSYVFYDHMHKDIVSDRNMLVSHLRKAIERDELRLHFQPIIDAHDSISTVEALIRWPHPELGYIPPVQFIPIAEETGLIIPIGEWVLRQACLQHGVWMKSGLPPFCISVNVSLRQFLNQDFVAVVDRIMQETGMEPQYLILEITESYVHKHVEQASYVLRQLKKRGIQIAIDDFGTGYSSLSRLKTLPVHVLKMDRSFVRYLPSDHANASIVQAIIQLGHSLQLKVIAEGVETAEELAYLHSLGCELFQGYFISPPLAADEFEARFHEFGVMECLVAAAEHGG